MSDGEFKLAQIRLGRKYSMGLRYIRSMGGDTVLESDKARINLVGRIYPSWGRICPTRAAATTLEPDGDRINLAPT
jgi:hypothetical protein